MNDGPNVRRVAATWRALLGLWVLCTGVCGCKSRTEPQRSRLADEGRDLVANAASAEGALSALRDAYRLKPDARMLGAFRQLPTLLGGKPADALEVTFKAGKWQVSSAGRSVGELGENPGFLELLALLEREAGALASNAALPAGPGPELSFAPHEPWLGLARLDADVRAGKRTVEHIRLAAQGLTLLLTQMTDGMGVGDAVPAQALAALALAEVLSKQELPRERALLAMQLGYSRDAARAVTTLSPEDPVSAYARADLAALEAAQAKRDPLAMLLYANALETRGLLDRLRGLLHGVPKEPRPGPRIGTLISRTERSPGFAASAVANTALAVQRSLGAKTEDYLSAALTKAAFHSLTGTGEGLLAGQMAALDKLAAQPGGPFLPAPVLAAFFRANLLNGVDDMGRYFLDTLGSNQAADAFSAWVGAGAERYSEQFHRYYRDLIAARERGLTPKALAADIADLNAFGVHALHATYAALFEVAAHDPVGQQTAKELAKRCDTRIECRSLLRFAAWRDLLDLELFERLSRSIITDAAALRPDLVLMESYRKRDLEALRAQIADPHLGATTKLQVLQGMVHIEPKLPLDNLYREAIASDPGRFTPVEDYAKYLVADGRAGEAQEQIERWLATIPNKLPFDVLVANTALARVLQQQGKLSEAWEKLEPLLESQYGGALMRAALVRLEQGEFSRAEDIARRRLARYPDANSVGLLARILWSEGKFDEAALLITEGPYRPSLNDFATIFRENFALGLAKRPVTEAHTAMSALATRRVHPQWLLYLAGGLSLHKDYERAVAAREGANAPGLAKLFFVCASYGDLVTAKGKEGATAWLKQNVLRSMTGPLSQFCYETGSPEVSWTVTPTPPPDQPHSAYIWLLRTAAFVRADPRPPEWKQALDAYYGTDVDAFYDQLGRHLLGQVTLEQLWSELRGPDKISEAAYFAGLRAQVAGDYARAVSLYRMVLENHATQEGESRWAYHQLSRWRSQGLTLAELARRRL